MWTSEIKVIYCRNQNMAVLFNVFAGVYNSVISSDFGYVSDILTLPAIICADK